MLAGSQVASATTDTTIYTVPANTAVRVASFAIANTSTTAPVVINKVSVVPNGGAVDGTHQMLTNYQLLAGDTISHGDVLSFVLGMMLDAGARIVINVSVAATANYLLTGAESS